MRRNLSGVDPNCIIMVGHGPRADRVEQALASIWRMTRLEDVSEPQPRAIYVEAAGDHRHEQLAALRQISAAAPDDAIIITTSPILSQSEIAGSVTEPARLVGLVPPWSIRTRICEVVRGALTSQDAVSLALRMAGDAGWSALEQCEGGPSAVTRLCGSVMIASWNLAQRTGTPGAIDRAARQWGLPWSPLRAIDEIGLARLAAIFDRGGQAAGIDSIYRSVGDEAPSEAFGAKCGNDLIEAKAAIGYLLEGAIDAAVSLQSDFLATSSNHLQRLMTAALGRSVARQLSRALSARYPELKSPSPTTAPA